MWPLLNIFLGGKEKKQDGIKRLRFYFKMAISSHSMFLEGVGREGDENTTRKFRNESHEYKMSRKKRVDLL